MGLPLLSFSQGRALLAGGRPPLTSRVVGYHTLPSERRGCRRRGWWAAPPGRDKKPPVHADAPAAFWAVYAGAALVEVERPLLAQAVYEGGGYQLPDFFDRQLYDWIQEYA